MIHVDHIIPKLAGWYNLTDNTWALLLWRGRPTKMTLIRRADKPDYLYKVRFVTDRSITQALTSFLNEQHVEKRHEEYGRAVEYMICEMGWEKGDVRGWEQDGLITEAYQSGMPRLNQHHG